MILRRRRDDPQIQGAAGQIIKLPDRYRRWEHLLDPSHIFRIWIKQRGNLDLPEPL
jgi:hypothetical protein